MKLYTKTGDDGTTGLFGGGRVPKASARVDAYGTVDETNATIGLARSTGLAPAIDAVLAKVQEDLFVIGAELACVPGREGKLNMPLIASADVERLERAIDEADASAPTIKTFVHLNRLSDLLFALARSANVAAGVPDVPWSPRG
jgi:cob(I)alamin adenosyltransferase